MSLVERAKAKPEKIHGTPCSVGLLLAELEGDELAALQKILFGRPGLTGTMRGVRGWDEADVHEAVTAEGYSVAKSQINVHRGKNCRCYRTSK